MGHNNENAKKVYVHCLRNDTSSPIDPRKPPPIAAKELPSGKNVTVYHYPLVDGTPFLGSCAA